MRYFSIFNRRKKYSIVYFIATICKMYCQDIISNGIEPGENTYRRQSLYHFTVLCIASSISILGL